MDTERMLWQGTFILRELWLLEGHLKNGCTGCGGDYECCRKHTTNIMDAATETRSTTVAPVCARAVELAACIRSLAPCSEG